MPQPSKSPVTVTASACGAQTLKVAPVGVSVPPSGGGPGGARSGGSLPPSSGGDGLTPASATAPGGTSGEPQAPSVAASASSRVVLKARFIASSSHNSPPTRYSPSRARSAVEQPSMIREQTSVAAAGPANRRRAVRR